MANGACVTSQELTVWKDQTKELFGTLGEFIIAFALSVDKHEEERLAATANAETASAKSRVIYRYQYRLLSGDGTGPKKWTNYSIFLNPNADENTRALCAADPQRHRIVVEVDTKLIAELK